MAKNSWIEGTDYITMNRVLLYLTAGITLDRGHCWIWLPAPPYKYVECA